jgi:glycosyltransferase involved in cell wall biosynthesis
MSKSQQSILIVLATDKLGGAEQVLRKIAVYHNTDQVVVCFLTDCTNENWGDGIENVVFKHFKGSNYVKNLIKLFFHFIKKRSDFDKVYSSQSVISGALGFFRKLGVLKTEKLILRESTSVFLRFQGFKKVFYTFFYQIGYSAADLIICQTDLMLNQLLNQFPKLALKSVVINNPFDFPSQQQVNELLDFEDAFIVSVGRLIPEKGFDLLIEAFSIVKKSRKNLSLLILGEGKERERLTELILERTLDKSIHLVGHVNNVYPYFKKADLCVVSSRIEGFPNVLLQMMSVSSNVISTRCAGGIDKIPLLISVPVNDCEALINAIIDNTEKSKITNDHRFKDFLLSRTTKQFMKEIESQLETAKL